MTPLLSDVLGHLFSFHMLGIHLSLQLPAPTAEEFSVTVARRSQPEDFRSSPSHLPEQRCVCHKSDSYPTVQTMISLLRLLAAPGANKRLVQVQFQNVCSGNGVSDDHWVTTFKRVALEGGSCAAGIFNEVLLCAVLSQYVERPTYTQMRVLGALSVFTQIHQCPIANLSRITGFSAVAPPPFITAAGLAHHYQKTLAAGRHRKTLIGHSLLTMGQPEPDCDGRAADATYRWQALRLQRRRGTSVRVACLVPAVWPAETDGLQLLRTTVARHCDLTQIYVAPPAESHLPSEWTLGPVSEGPLKVINLKAHFPIMLPDSGAVRRGDEDEGTYKRKLVWRSNLIQKVLFMLMHASRTPEVADVFCRLDLDTLFVAENLRAFVNVVGLKSSDKYFLGKLQYFWMYTHGVFPDGGAGLCLTSGSLEALGAVLAKAPGPADATLKVGQTLASWCLDQCAFVQGHFDDVVLGQCLRLANVTAHPALEDAIGRAYFSPTRLPCAEHTLPDDLERAERAKIFMRQPLHAPPLEVLARWGSGLHRFLPCMPARTALLPDHWLSPYAVSFHGYKDPVQFQQAYNVIYRNASCSWLFGYRHRVL